MIAIQLTLNVKQNLGIYFGQKMSYLGLICLWAFLFHHGEEFLEVDGAVTVQIGLHDKLQDLVLRRVLPDRPHHL